MRPVAIFRPEPGACRTEERAQQLGLATIRIPLFRVEPREWQIPDGRFDGLLLTSANAVRHGGPNLAALTHLPVHAVGSATADAARQAGFTVATCGEGFVESLLASLPEGLRLLHPGGVHRRNPERAHQEIIPVAVYEAVAIPDPAGMERLAGSVALVHSPRAGRRLAELVPDPSKIAIAAISGAAAETCGEGWERIAIAASPDDDALLSLAARLCEQSRPS